MPPESGETSVSFNPGIFNNRFAPSTIYPTPGNSFALVGNVNAGQVTLILGERVTKGRNSASTTPQNDDSSRNFAFSVTSKEGSPATNANGVLQAGSTTSDAYWWTSWQYTESLAYPTVAKYVYGPCTIQIVPYP